MIRSFHVVLPVWNEEARIADVLSHYTRHCSLVTVVDNFSTDLTVDVALTSFPEVEICKLANAGTTETPEWWISATQFFKAEYILFASCSEFVSSKLLDLFDRFSKAQLADLLDVPRRSLTNCQSTDYLYCKPGSLLSKSNIFPSVTRLVKWSTVNPNNISPHDSFRSQSFCTRLSLESTESELTIIHLRPPASFKTVQKHRDYAREYALSKYMSRPVMSVPDSVLRSGLDTLRVIRSIIDSHCNKEIITEYFLRLFMHCQVIWFSFFSRKAN